MRESRSIRSISIAAVTLTLWVAVQVPAYGQVAPDPTGVGPLATTSAEYRFPASVDPDILAGRFTELWARVYRPTDLSGAPFPVLVFLHGNHATCGIGSNPRIDNNCQYTTTGTCPAGYVVVPNHAGYSYLANRLASWGYIVVSINANRGITCGGGAPGDGGLNLARGRLVLKHLQKLSEWNNGIEATPPSLGVNLTGSLDFSSSGLLGHSRGGEGVRAAYNQYYDVGSPWPARIPDAVNFQGIFEIGAVDGQTSRVLNADGTVWNQLLPMCDGDVSNLQGVKPFDRMMRIDEDPATQKSTFTVWGANHNFYNTEWQQSDSPGCLGHAALFPQTIGSPQQRQTGLVGVMGFFRGNIGPGADPNFNQNFNPQFAPTTAITSVTRVDRGYTDSPSSTVTTVFEDFDRPTGTNTYGFPNNHSNISITHGTVPNHDPVQRAGVISWTAGPNRFFQTNWTPAGDGGDISDQLTLDLRVSRQSSALNPAGPTNFSIQLALADGTLSNAVQLQTYTDLRGPVGGVRGGLHPILQTARIPLSEFSGCDLTQVRGVRLAFDRTPSGAIYVANIRLSNTSSLGATSLGGDLSADLDQWTSTAEPMSTEEITQGNQIQIRTVEAALGLQGQPGVEIEVSSDREFPVRNELVVLQIGGQEFKLSRYPESGDTHTLIFTLTPEEFAQTNDNDQIVVKYGSGESNVRWSFGPLNKSMVNQ